MKTLLLILIVILTLSLSAQDYTFVRGTFNAAGGSQQNAGYSSQTAVGEYVQGGVSTDDYTGYLGFLFPLLDQSPPVITSIDDVPNDQGRRVQIVWNKCAFDDVYNFGTYYSIWRYDEDFGGRSNITGKNASKKATSLTYPEPWQVVQQFQLDPQQTYHWENGREVWTFVDTVRALTFDQYSYIAHTLADSSSSGSNEATFKVVFHDEFAYYESPTASGYSTDDIAPDATANVAIALNQSFRNSSITLSWDEVSTGTFEGNVYEEINGIWYRIYASDSPVFECDENSYLTTTTATEYEFDVSGHPKQFFKIIVSDEP